MTAPHDARTDGFPLLNREPLPLPDLPRSPTTADHARAYGTTVVLWARLWTRVVDALEWLHGAWYSLHAEVGQMRGELAAARVELLEEIRRRPSARPKLPSFSSFRPEETNGGGFRVTSEQLQALQAQVADLAADLEEAQQAKRDAENREAGAKGAIAALEQVGEKRRRSIAFWLALAVAGGGLVSWVLSHVLHV